MSTTINNSEQNIKELIQDSSAKEEILQLITAYGERTRPHALRHLLYDLVGSGGNYFKTEIGDIKDTLLELMLFFMLPEVNQLMQKNLTGYTAKFLPSKLLRLQTFFSKLQRPEYHWEVEAVDVNDCCEKHEEWFLEDIKKDYLQLMASLQDEEE